MNRHDVSYAMLMCVTLTRKWRETQWPRWQRAGVPGWHRPAHIRPRHKPSMLKNKLETTHTVWTAWLPDLYKSRYLSYKCPANVQVVPAELSEHFSPIRISATVTGAGALDSTHGVYKIFSLKKNSNTYSTVSFCDLLTQDIVHFHNY